MEPQHLIFGGGATQTNLNPVAALGMLVAIALILCLPRNKVILVFLLAFYNIPLTQVILVGGLHFPVVRILVMAALVKRAISRDASMGKFPGGVDSIDKLVILWTILELFVSSLSWLDTQATIKFIGDFLDACGGYLAIRFLVPDKDAVRRTLKALAVVCLIQGLCMVSEQFTHQNVFRFLGATNEPVLRDGHLRSEGLLGSIQGGTFGGASIPLFLWLWADKRSRVAASLGITGGTAMAYASFASTSWIAYAAGLGALILWPLRRNMRLLRWGLVATLLGLQMVMHGPVWSLIEKIDITGGSSSYHRYMLVDNCIRHFGDWWLLGYKYYGSWGFDMWDLCNQFVSVALTGGLASLVVYIAILSRGFGRIGDARKQVGGDREQEWKLWCLGCALFANVVASFGINYMVQLETYLFTLLVCIAVETGMALNTAAEVPSQNPMSHSGQAMTYLTPRASPMPRSVRSKIPG